MKIKGTAVSVTPEFIKKFFPAKYNEWIQSLPYESLKILNNPIFATDWYSLYDAVIAPTEIAGLVLFGGNKALAAREIGKYSGEIALQGIYKIFLRITAPGFVLGRATNVFSSYYDDAQIVVIEKSDKHTVLQFSGFSGKESLIIERIAGWIQKALDLTGNPKHEVTIETEGSELNPVYTIRAQW
ncbi:MAG TPA: hypothetical protein DCQ31_08735 [Bacteroidales bacterium]|nr:hypothetical protein [Bacteroidales bacterium]